MKQVVLATILILLLVNSSCEQEQLGLHQENYAGINATAINPANSFLTPHLWDLNIISAGVFYKNDYAFAKNTNTLKIYNNRNIISFQYDGDESGNKSYLPGVLSIDFFNKKNNSYIALSGNLTGPSFSVKLNHNTSIGFISGFRFLGGIPKIPPELNYYTFYNRPFGQTFQLLEINAGLISWKEYGINYVNKIRTYPFIVLAGGTIKYLEGNEAMFLHLSNGAQFQQLHNDSLAISKRFELEYGYTNTSISKNKLSLRHNGSGMALDMGTTFIFGDKIDEYKFRIGISLLDLGFIHYYNNSYEYYIKIDSVSQIDLKEFKDVNQLSDLESLNAQLSRVLLNDSDKSFQSNSFYIRTPTALSIQFDYSFSKLFYIQAILLQRIKSRRQKITRPNIFSISPRFQHRWFSFSPSLTIYDWKTFHIGSSIRIGYLTIGSDNMSGLWTDKLLYTGSDFYIGLKFNPFKIGKKNKYSKNLNRKIKCYKFE